MRCEEQLLMEFVAARLDFRQSLVVAQHLHDCRFCREQVQILAALTALYRDQEENKRQTPRLAARPVAGWGKAATILLAVVVGLLWSFSSGDPQFHPRQLATQQSYPYFPLRTRNSSMVDLQAEAFTAYSRGDYSRAAELLARLNPEPEILFYQGVSLYLAGQSEPALKVLEKPAVIESAWRIPALWYRVHALLKLDRSGEARELLSREEFDHGQYREQAESLRQRLSQIGSGPAASEDVVR